MPRRPTPWLEHERKIKKNSREIRKRILNGEEFIDWRDVRPNVIWVNYGFFEFDRYRLIHDNMSGQDWYCPLTSDGQLEPKIRPQKRVGNRDGTYVRIIELPYTNEQFDMIATSLWLLGHGWIASEIYHLLLDERLHWTHLPGQTPLSIGKINSWYSNHVKQLRKGIVWP
jgi:hypothetical protein